jgi:hypothetical protein
VIVKDERTSGSRTWAHLNVKPGQYRLTVSATGPDDKPVSAAVVVKPAEVSRPAIALSLG